MKHKRYVSVEIIWKRDRVERVPRRVGCCMHWSELIGGDVILTIPYEWQKLFNASDGEVGQRINTPVPEEILDELQRKFIDFRRADDGDSLRIAELIGIRATVRTLPSFIGPHDLTFVVRDFMLPHPDAKAKG